MSRKTFLAQFSFDIYIRLYCGKGAKVSTPNEFIHIKFLGGANRGQFRYFTS